MTILRTKLSPFVCFGVASEEVDLVDDIVDVRLQLVLGYYVPVGEVRVVLRGDAIPDAEDGYRAEVFDPVEVFEESLD